MVALFGPPGNELKDPLELRGVQIRTAVGIVSLAAQGMHRREGLQVAEVGEVPGETVDVLDLPGSLGELLGELVQLIQSPGFQGNAVLGQSGGDHHLLVGLEHHPFHHHRDSPVFAPLLRILHKGQDEALLVEFALVEVAQVHQEALRRQARDLPDGPANGEVDFRIARRPVQQVRGQLVILIAFDNHLDVGMVAHEAISGLLDWKLLQHPLRRKVVESHLFLRTSYDRGYCRYDNEQSRR